MDLYQHEPFLPDLHPKTSRVDEELMGHTYIHESNHVSIAKCMLVVESKIEDLKISLRF